MGGCVQKEDIQEQKTFSQQDSIDSQSRKSRHYESNFIPKLNNVSQVSTSQKGLDFQKYIPSYDENLFDSQFTTKSYSGSLTNAYYQCQICGLNVENIIIQLDCHHHFHLNCIQENIREKLLQQKQIIECPKCLRRIDNQQLYSINPILLNQLLDIQIEYLNQTKATARCQTLMCQFFIMGDDKTIQYCPLCED